MSEETPKKSALFEEFEKLRMEADVIRSSIQNKTSQKNQKKNPLFEEFEKLRRETPGINSIMQNPSSGLVSQTTLNEVPSILGSMSKKQEELEEHIKENQKAQELNQRKLEEEQEELKEQIMENRKVQQQSTDELWKKIDEKLNTLSGKFEKLPEERISENRKVQEKLHENIINRISKRVEELIMENREIQRKEESILSNNQVKIYDKLEKMEQGMTVQQPSTLELSKKIDKLEKGLDVINQISKKQGELEKQIMENQLKIQENSTGELWKKIDEKLNTLSGKFEKLLEERINENRRVQKNNQLKIHNKLEVIGQELKTQQQSTTSELSRKVEEKFKQLSGKIDKLEKGLKTVIKKLDQRPENSHQPNNSKPSLNNPNIANQPEPPIPLPRPESPRPLDRTRKANTEIPKSPMNKPPMTNVSSELKKPVGQTLETSKKEGESPSNQQTKKDNDDDKKIKVTIFNYQNNSRNFHIEVKKSDKIEILDSEVIDHFGFKPSRYVFPSARRYLNPESTFGENNLKDEDVIICEKPHGWKWGFL